MNTSPGTGVPPDPNPVSESAGEPIGELGALIRASLAQWRVEGRVHARRDAVEIAIEGAGRRLIDRVRPAASRLPVWRLRGYAADGTLESDADLPSINALLRRLRIELDPDFAPGKAIVGTRAASAR